MILDRYRIVSSIGSGAFGKVYKCYDTKHSRIIALKTGDTSKPRSQQRMEQEYQVYMKLQGAPGIPKLYTIHRSNQIWYLSMECMGINLMKLWKLCNQSFSEKTVIMIGIQMLFRLQTIHERGIIHRDIKPDNFVMGRNSQSHCLYMLDFGLSSNVNEPQSPVFTGSLRYASRNNHKGLTYTKMDDLESMLYILIYFYSGSLPWQFQDMEKENIRSLQEQIGQYKETITVETLCKSCPRWLQVMAKHILHPNQNPDYVLYKKLMQERLKELKETFDYVYDWSSLPKRVILR